MAQIQNPKTRVFAIDPDSVGGLEAVQEAAEAGRTTLVALVNPSDDKAVYSADSPLIGDAENFYTSIVETYNPSSDPVLYVSYSTTEVYFTLNDFISSYSGGAGPVKVDVFIFRSPSKSISVEVPGVGPVPIYSTTNPEFKKTNAVAVDPADAYWFDELHGKDTEQGVVYYVRRSNDEGPLLGTTLDEILSNTVQLAPETYFDKPFDESMLVRLPGSIETFGLDDWRYYGEDRKQLSTEDNLVLISYVVAIYMSKESSDK